MSQVETAARSPLQTLKHRVESFLRDFEWTWTNAVLFSLYHFWTPWQNIGRILGLLPWIYTVWRKRSVALSMAIHISVNCIFLLLVLAAVTAD